MKRKTPCYNGSTPCYNNVTGCYNNAADPASLWVKHSVDAVMAVVALVVFAPVFGIVYIAIKMEDGGPVFFCQQRVGRGGRLFTLYKFRSMIVESEKDGNPRLCRDHDERLTRVGAFLRSHHLDELPQLWNVLKGEMSFVGHRPERMFFVRQIIQHNPDYKHLYRLRPGLFSHATLYNGYTDTMEKMLKRLEMDLHYLQTRSLLVDMKIIMLTAFSIIGGKKF